MSEVTTIARPYAKAAFDFAVEKGTTDKWAEMLIFAAQVAENDAMADLLTGSMTADALADVFINVCGEQLDEFGQNLIKVMAENERLNALPAVAQLYAEYQAELANEICANVTSAVELTEKQKADLTANLEKRLARKVKLNCNIDSALVSGMIIEAGDLVIDGSVRSKLDRLADALQS